MPNSFESLLKEVRACTLCKNLLPKEPRPIIQCSESAKILIVGQAPGIRAHDSGMPFNDPSGDRLRRWMGIDRETFYEPSKIALLPMGFCYPGTGPTGDFPPRPECAATWREKLLNQLPHIELTLVIGQYAHKWHINNTEGLTETVRSFEDYLPTIFPLPHPSPRNNMFLKKHPWFEEDVIPRLKKRVAEILSD